MSLKTSEKLHIGFSGKYCVISHETWYIVPSVRLNGASFFLTPPALTVKETVANLPSTICYDYQVRLFNSALID